MQTINLNLIPGGVMPVVNLSQYDEGRQYKILIHEGSAEYSLTGKTLTVQGTKSDNKGFSYTETDKVHGTPVITKSGNEVTITSPVQMTAAAGRGVAELKIGDSSGNAIYTLNFVLNVEKSALDDGTDISETVLPAIMDAAARNAGIASDAAQTATAAAQSAASSASSAGSSAESALSSKDAAENAAEVAIAGALHPPYISETTGNWMVYNITDEAYEDSGIDASITVQIADITMLDPSDPPSVTNSGTSTDPVFHLFIPRGSGIKTILKKGTEELTDTYTIICSDGYTFDYHITNGRGIERIEQTETSGLDDTYTITYNDGTVSAFTVTNGKTAYQSAVEGGYVGTEAQFESDIANMEVWAREASGSADAAADSATRAESWAVGGTGVRDGEDTNNAAYWSQKSLQQAQEATRQADIATQYAAFVTPHYIIQDNRLYVQDAAAPQWTVVNNRLCIKLAV